MINFSLNTCWRLIPTFETLQHVRVVAQAATFLLKLL